MRNTFYFYFVNQICSEKFIFESHDHDACANIHDCYENTKAVVQRCSTKSIVLKFQPTAKHHCWRLFLIKMQASSLQL